MRKKSRKVVNIYQKTSILGQYLKKFINIINAIMIMGIKKHLTKRKILKRLQNQRVMMILQVQVVILRQIRALKFICQITAYRNNNHEPLKKSELLLLRKKKQRQERRTIWRKKMIRHRMNKTLS